MYFSKHSCTTEKPKNFNVQYINQLNIYEPSFHLIILCNIALAKIRSKHTHSCISTNKTKNKIKLTATKGEFGNCGRFDLTDQTAEKAFENWTQNGRSLV